MQHANHVAELGLLSISDCCGSNGRLLPKAASKLSLFGHVSLVSPGGGHETQNRLYLPSGGAAVLADIAGNSFTGFTATNTLVATFCNACPHACNFQLPEKALTIKSPILVQSILEGRKQVENRSRRLAPGWYSVYART